ncbi:MAG TPA: hypothetical protein VNG51_29475 [Ktedonobacteraceae bacterium]|nr:hypothetical protein [Ktedonobacteraceae bacterium]
MRAAAVALVLLVGAVVILWFGNTLNSWVLGGLIGGFAALLISIPISVTLFLYLSRRHDEKLSAEQVEPSVSFEPSDPYLAEQHIDVYEADVDGTGEDWYDEEDEYISTTGRNLPIPAYTRAPAVRQSQALTNSGMSQANTRQRSTSLQSTRRPTSQLSVQRQYGLNFPRQGRKPPHNQHLTSALRAARLEALQQQADEEMYSPSTSKRLPVVRPDQRDNMRPSAQSEQPTRQFQSPFPRQNQYRSRRVVDGTSMPAIGNPGYQRSLPSEGGSHAGRQAQHYGQHYNQPDTGQIGGVGASDPDTGQLQGHDYYPQTGPMRPQPRTGQIARNPQIEEQRGNPERVSGTLQNPMVRRAPYMYEDDPMRQEFARHLTAPAVRRSSRKLRPEEAED